jgi:hypothetical protein
MVRAVVPVLLAALAAGCGSILDVKPTNEIADSQAIVDGPSARAALHGAYDALQSIYYYGEDFVIYGDLSADNVSHTGTYSTYADAGGNRLKSNHGDIAGIWQAIYDAINRANVIIAKVPSVSLITDKDRAQILGEAHFLRALHYHNLVKLWGDVPIVTAPITSITEASQVSRASVADVYAQITTDLSEAEKLITEVGNTRQGTVGAVKALQARVRLYQKDWAGAERAADSVAAMGYSLAPDYADLFTANGSDTREDIFRVIFTAEDATLLGYLYLASGAPWGGRREIAPTPSMVAAYDSGDARKAWSISYDKSNRVFGSKYPTAMGAEHPHVIRFAEVILIRAEALARQGRLEDAVDEYNQLRVRAKLTPHIYGTDVTTQDEVIAAILRERRVELAFEGDRWADLNRNGLAVATLGLPADRAYQVLYPIPQRERDVAPNLTQNPGY